MLAYILEFLRDQSVLVFFLVLSLGYLVGNTRVAGIGLGGIWSERRGGVQSAPSQFLTAGSVGWVDALDFDVKNISGGALSRTYASFFLREET
jgi:hypothetical protein